MSRFEKGLVFCLICLAMVSLTFAMKDSKQPPFEEIIMIESPAIVDYSSQSDDICTPEEADQGNSRDCHIEITQMPAFSPAFAGAECRVINGINECDAFYAWLNAKANEKPSIEFTAEDWAEWDLKFREMIAKPQGGEQQ